MARKLITEQMVIEAARFQKTMEVPKDAIITSLARDKAKQLGVRLITAEIKKEYDPSSPIKPGAENKIALGSDHGGYAMKEFIKTILRDLKYQVVDVGTNSNQAVDYPDFAHAVARLVSEGDCFRGIMIDGAGIGSCMVANKVPNVRAAMCYDLSTAVNSREHNNANVLTLGGKMIGELLAEQIVKVWLKTEFSGGRHQNRVDKINNTEKKYFR
jgi:ribose 5-phosphate isomerase B